MNKPAAQVSLEMVLKNNEEATRLLGENARIKAEMHEILKSVPPPASRPVEAFNSTPPSRMATMPSEPDSVRMVAEKEVVFAALAIVRSWKRRKKKNWQNQERELVAAVERLTWDK